VNTLLLDKIGSDNRGYAEYVKPEEDIEEKVSLLYNKIESPLFADVNVKFEGVEVMSLMPRQIPDVYKGMQLAVYGKYRKAGSAKVEITGVTGKDKKTYTLNVEFPNENTTNDFIPRLWAAQRIAFLMDQITMVGKEDKELVDEIIDLSKKYGVVTRYTAMLITEDNIRLGNGELRKKMEEKLKTMGDDRKESGKGDKEQSQRAQELSKDLQGLQTKPGQEAYGWSKLAEAENKARDDAKRHGQNIVNVWRVTNKTFYNVGGVWTDSKYDEKDKDKIQKIKFGSEEYFRLIEDATLAKYLSVGESMIVVYKGNIYQIECPKSEKKEEQEK
jgi:Ca-activated chloride channel family protein